MKQSVATAALLAHRERPEPSRPVMAKADLRFPENRDLRPEIGRALDYARQDNHWTLDELAGHLQPPDGSERRDPRQVARWIAGTETAPFHILLSCVALRASFLFHLFRLVTPEVEVTQQITVRRTA